ATVPCEPGAGRSSQRARVVGPGCTSAKYVTGVPTALALAVIDPATFVNVHKTSTRPPRSVAPEDGLSNVLGLGAQETETPETPRPSASTTRARTESSPLRAK